MTFGRPTLRELNPHGAYSPTGAADVGSIRGVVCVVHPASAPAGGLRRAAHSAPRLRSLPPYVFTGCLSTRQSAARGWRADNKCYVAFLPGASPGARVVAGPQHNTSYPPAVPAAPQSRCDVGSGCGLRSSPSGSRWSPYGLARPASLPGGPRRPHPMASTCRAGGPSQPGRTTPEPARPVPRHARYRGPKGGASPRDHTPANTEEVY